LEKKRRRGREQRRAREIGGLYEQRLHQLKRRTEITHIPRQHASQGRDKYYRQHILRLYGITRIYDPCFTVGRL